LSGGGYLRGAVDHLSIFDETLNQPVILTTASNPPVDASLAKIKVAIIASAAVMVLIGD
jgi:hypothetical protein